MNSLKHVILQHSIETVAIIEIEAHNLGIGIMDLVETDVEPYNVAPHALSERRLMLHG